MDNTTKSTLYEQESVSAIQKWEKTRKKNPVVSGVIEHIEKKGWDPRDIREVYWCGGQGSLDKIIGKDARGNPSDLVIEFTNDKFFGVSLKTKNKNTNITYKNLGLNTIGNYLGYDYSFIYNKYENIIVDNFGLPENHKERKELLKSNLDLKHTIDMQGHILLQLLLNNPEWGLKEMYKKKTHKENVNHILDVWMNAKNPAIPYIIVTDTPKGVDIIDPMKSQRRKKLIKSKELIWGTNGTSLTVNLPDLNIMVMRIKFTSFKFASSIKFSGEFT